MALSTSCAVKVLSPAGLSQALTQKRSHCKGCIASVLDPRKLDSRRTKGSSLLFGKQLVISHQIRASQKRAPLIRASKEQQNGANTAVQEKEEEPVIVEKVDKAKQTEEEAQLTLSDINPVSLGRRSREFFNDVWKRLTDLGQLTRSSPSDVDPVLVRPPWVMLPHYEQCAFARPLYEVAGPKSVEWHRKGKPEASTQGLTYTGYYALTFRLES
jgi:hypothetical protein